MTLRRVRREDAALYMNREKMNPLRVEITKVTAICLSFGMNLSLMKRSDKEAS